MSRANQYFESALERLARIMTRNYEGINVVIQGNIAATDGKTIWLPMLEDVPEELMADLNGFLDHEVSHCLFTIFPELKKCLNRFHRELLNAVEDSRIEKLIIDRYPGCESNLDRMNAKWKVKVREKRKSMPWPIRLILAIREVYDGNKPEVDDDFAPLFDCIEAQAKALPKCKTTTALRIATEKMIHDINDERRKLAMDMPDMDESETDSDIATETPIGLKDDNPKSKKKQAKGNAELDPSVKEEKDKKKKEKGKPEESEGDDSESGDGDESGDMSGKDDSDEAGDEKGDQSGNDSGEGGEQGDKEGGGESDSDEGNSDSSSDADSSEHGSTSNNDEDENRAESTDDNEPNHIAPKDKGEDKPKEDKSDNGKSGKNDKKNDVKSDKSDESDKDAETPEPKAKPLEKRRNYAKWVESDRDKKMMEEKDEQPDSEYDKHIRSPESYMENAIKHEVSNQPKVPQNRYSGYYDGHKNISTEVSLPISRQFDEVNDFTNKGDQTEYAAAKREVMPMINPIKQTLERILKVKENAKYRFNRERGAINTRALAQVVSSPQFREPFKEFTKTDTSNVAVSLVIDQSGSMHGNKIAIARQAALAIGESLAALNISFEMVGFYTESDHKLATMAAGMTADESRRFNRFGERLVNNIFKSFDSPFLNGITKCISAGCNADGESILWAAKRLAIRKEKRKVMLVFSDGQPSYGGANHEVLAGDLKRVIHSLPKAGIEPVGFGINTEVVKLFYPEYVVVDDVAKLPTMVMNKVAKILERGIK